MADRRRDRGGSDVRSVILGLAGGEIAEAVAPQLRDGAQSFIEWWRRERGEPFGIDDLLKGLGAVVAYEFVRHTDLIPTSRADEALAAVTTAYLLWLLAVPQKTDNDVAAEDIKAAIIEGVQILYPEDAPGVLKWLGELTPAQLKKLVMLFRRLKLEDIADLLSNEEARQALSGSKLLDVSDGKSGIATFLEENKGALSGFDKFDKKAAAGVRKLHRWLKKKGVVADGPRYS